MLKNNIKRYLILTAVLLVSCTAYSYAQEAELLELLRSDATRQDKSAACRQLARIATVESVPTLAELLGDEELSHMARYALEGIRDPSVDAALRDALGKVQGRPLLGVIGSIGVRRDAEAVDALAGLFKDPDAAQAVARSLGNIGTLEAANALEYILARTLGGNQLAVCEGLLRCAEALAADAQADSSQGIYDRLYGWEKAPSQVRAAALRGAILSRGEDGVPLLVEAISSSDDALAAAAVRAAMESPRPEITDALMAELPEASVERQGLLILALAECGESRVLPTVLQAVQGGDGQLRIIAFRALKRVGDASCVPALLDAAVEGDEEVSLAAMESLESLQDESVDDQITTRLSEAQGKMRIVLMELVTRRRTVTAAPSLWAAADDADLAVRIAALTGLGALLETDDLSKLIERLATTEEEEETTALDNAICEVCRRSEDQESVASLFIAAMPTVDESVMIRILDMLNVIGGEKSLETVAAVALSSSGVGSDAAFRVLGQWKSADAAPVLIDLHNTVGIERLQIRAIRAYIRIARQFDMPVERRAEMCRTALETADRDTDKQLVLEVLLRYPGEEMQAIALEAAEIPALKEQALLVVMGMAGDEVNRAKLGRILAQAGQTPVELEIISAVYGADEKSKDVTAILRQHAGNYRIIFLPSSSYNESFGGDPAQGIVKRLIIKYRIDGKDGEVALRENAMIVLPLPE
jgi:HEAT repeat protein